MYDSIPVLLHYLRSLRLHWTLVAPFFIHSFVSLNCLTLRIAPQGKQRSGRQDCKLLVIKKSQDDIDRCCRKVGKHSPIS